MKEILNISSLKQYLAISELMFLLEEFGVSESSTADARKACSLSLQRGSIKDYSY